MRRPIDPYAPVTSTPVPAVAAASGMTLLAVTRLALLRFSQGGTGSDHPRPGVLPARRIGAGSALSRSCAARRGLGANGGDGFPGAGRGHRSRGDVLRRTSARRRRLRTGGPAWKHGYDPMTQTIPMHPSYEDRSGVPDRIFTALTPSLAEHQVRAWRRVLDRVDVSAPSVLHLHHLTPLHEAAMRRSGPLFQW